MFYCDSIQEIFFLNNSVIQLLILPFSILVWFSFWLFLATFGQRNQDMETSLYNQSNLIWQHIMKICSPQHLGLRPHPTFSQFEIWPLDSNDHNFNHQCLAEPIYFFKKKFFLKIDYFSFNFLLLTNLMWFLSI